MNIRHIELNKFGHANPRRIQYLKHCLIAQAEGSVRFRCIKKSFYFTDRQYFRQLPFRFRCFNMYGRILIDLLFTNKKLVKGTNGSRMACESRGGSSLIF
ncbi:hypothetical protein KBTX_04545 [wastewater metagenome]|uniref:Uncharacterized protein n=2 Tax=unclassified sequences TaxID=12908 RepID=A0A5B8RLH2_9ZZZZ|nr:hypothetical protein KBTEX_04545 [uncultured organism]